MSLRSIAQRFDGMPHAILNLLKIMILSYKRLHIGEQPKLKYSNKTFIYGDCKINSLYKDYIKDTTFILRNSCPLKIATE